MHPRESLVLWSTTLGSAPLIGKEGADNHHTYRKLSEGLCAWGERMRTKNRFDEISKDRQVSERVHRITATRTEAAGLTIHYPILRNTAPASAEGLLQLRDDFRVTHGL